MLHATVVSKQCWHHEFSFRGGGYTHGVWGSALRRGVKGRSPSRGHGGQSLSSLQTLFADFDSGCDQNFILHNSPPDS